MPRVRWRAVLLFVTMLAGMAYADPGSGDDKPTSYQDELSCGEARFRLATTCMEDPSTGDSEYLTQSLWLTNNAHGNSTRVTIGLRLARRPLVRGRRVLNDRVTGWACIKSDSGRHYLL